MTHLSEAQVQGLADGTLRGPEGLAAREHCEACPACDADLALYEALVGRLAALRDPAPPPDFTAQVLGAVEVREAHLAQRRHTALAALSAGAVAAVAVLGWLLSAAPATQLDTAIENATTLRHVAQAASSVLEAIRLPLGLGSFGLFALVLLALQRTLRSGAGRAAIS